MKFVAPSWDEIYIKSIHLAEKIRKRENTPFDCLLGVSRGGLVLTRILSDLLDIQYVSVIKSEYYSKLGVTHNRPRISKIQEDLSGRSILLVDDVADTGESLVEIKKFLKSKKPKGVKVATLYIKPWSKVLPDYYVSNTDAWIVFPWELYESIKLLSARKEKIGLRKAHIPLKYARMLYNMDRKLRQI
ncbi:MAG TPA: phosphoribosyltransferase family protein [Nitrososphaerales archaeon]|nr:phosphoribosyltransferase family protein [Nitrososphaerales archaeon]